MSAIRIWNDTNPAASENFGTLTGVARSRLDPSKFFAITASHVVAPMPDPGSQLAATIGTTVSCLMPNGEIRRIGELWNWTELVESSSDFANSVDAAIIQIDLATAQALAAALPVQSAELVEPAQGLAFTYDGAVSGPCNAEVTGAPVTVMLNCMTASNAVATMTMTGLFPANGAAKLGDSGSLLIDNDGKAMGMLLAKGLVPGTSYFSRMDVVLDYFRVDLVTQDFAPAAQPAPLILTLLASDEKTLDIMTRTLWGEARDQPVAGIRGVAAVIRNRAARGPNYWWGGTIQEVCLKPFQFSCWNANDPNLPKLTAVSETDKEFRLCKQIATDATQSTLTDNVLGATHYHTRNVHPSWATRKIPCAEIGDHLFYNNIEPE